MKHLTVIFALILYAHIAFSQFTITDLRGNPVSDGAVQTYALVGDEADFKIKIQNNKDTEIHLRLSLESMTGTDGSAFIYCFESCFTSISEGHVSDIKTIAANSTTADDDVHFENLDDTQELITYVFKIYEDENPDNSITFTYKYDASSSVETLEDNGILLYPNPASDYLILQTKAGINASCFELRDAAGKLVKSERLSNGEINTIRLSNLPNGLYFYRITADGKLLKSRKLIVNQ